MYLNNFGQTIYIRTQTTDAMQKNQSIFQICQHLKNSGVSVTRDFGAKMKYGHMLEVFCELLHFAQIETGKLLMLCCILKHQIFRNKVTYRMTEHYRRQKHWAHRQHPYSWGFQDRSVLV